MPDFALQRRMMVDGQLRTFDVTQHDVISAFLSVPREAFVGQGEREIAYVDRPLKLPGADPRQRPREMMTPMVLARLIQAAQPRPASRALVVGAGTGYAAAILAAMGCTVTALESEPSLAEQARERLAAAGAEGVTVAEGPLAHGWPGGAPYDCVLLDGAFLVEPRVLLSQLSDDGKLVGVKGEGRAGKALLYRRSGDAFAARPVFDAAAPVLDEFRPEPAFVF
jgi:protein-L-isoaspartate(D-aspartate) O-methyltransferase